MFVLVSLRDSQRQFRFSLPSMTVATFFLSSGIRQYLKVVKFHPLPQRAIENKVNALVDLLSQISFSQCLVFSNYQLRLVRFTFWNIDTICSVQTIQSDGLPLKKEKKEIDPFCIQIGEFIRHVEEERMAVCVYQWRSRSTESIVCNGKTEGRFGFLNLTLHSYANLQEIREVISLREGRFVLHRYV